ncbi:uncharacterized protein LOC113634630 isoform X4 [Tachysurus fulvidraco]|nr:uncharacterized protein LOC113634630 isoform X4 [Tachysurus fulvidraco]
MVHLLIHNVLVQSIETREAFVGDTVILPCSIDHTIAGVDVFWRDDDEAVLLNFIKSEEDFSAQNREYRGRVQTFPNEIANGNFSIKLSNVKLSDSGTYTCKASGSVQSVELIVKENQTHNTERLQNQTGTWLQMSLIISVIMNCVLVITVFTVQRCRRSPKTQTQPPGSSQQQQHNGNHVYSEVQFPMTTRPTRTSDQNCTYALVNHLTCDLA